MVSFYSTHPLGPAGLAGEAEGRPTYPAGVGPSHPQGGTLQSCPSRALVAPATALYMHTLTTPFTRFTIALTLAFMGFTSTFTVGFTLST